MRTRYTKEQLEQAVKLNYSYAGTLRTLGLNPFGSAQQTLKKYINMFKIDISHFTGQAHLKNKNHDWNKHIPLNQVLVENSNYSRHTLKNV